MYPIFINLSRWNLSTLYSGDIEQSIIYELNEIEKSLNFLQCRHEKMETSTFAVNEEELVLMSETIRRTEKADSYYYCLRVESIDRSVLNLIQNRISTLKSGIRTVLSRWYNHFDNVQSPKGTHHYLLDGLREDKTFNFDDSYISELSIDCLKAWEDMYIQLRNNLEIVIDDDGKQVIRNFGEANQICMNNQDLNKRETTFNALTQSLEKNSPIFSSVLNHMAGIRLKAYSANKSKGPLEESLKQNGISLPILNTMWSAIDERLPVLTNYLQLKAEEQNADKLTWHQLMTSSQNNHQFNIPISYSEAIKEIIVAFEQINPAIGEFVLEAISNGWVDSELRDSKPPGGFCAPFISEKQSRISIRYDDSFSSARVLAHELGHAWHYRQIPDVPSLTFLDDRLEMTVAETASIFFELTFIDSLIQRADNSLLKQSLLNRKINYSLNYLMSVRGSFNFESQFYDSRESGPLSAKQIEDLSLDTQSKAFGDSLSEYQPFVWMKYIHFYIAEFPFYNYQYTFGYLLSLGLLEIAKKEGVPFMNKFNNFLSETGTKPVKDLLMQHFNVDLQQSDFWQNSLKQICNDIEEYTRLSIG